MKNKFAQRIKELRVENKLNQGKLAEILGVKQSCVSKWERGETLPDIEMLISIAEAFSVSTDYLLGVKEY
ncbi:MAG: helix-turn-helix transcriptional regulator [Clostridiales bacterium]|nr:helix-turn-helix transcriptional regulator [Clostridiales bacterium]